jgi:hypothetical protein
VVAVGSRELTESPGPQAIKDIPFGTLRTFVGIEPSPIDGQGSLAIRYVPAGLGSSSSAPQKQTQARDTSAPGWPKVVLR